MKYETEPTQSAELGKLHTRGVELRNEGERIKWYKPWTWGKIPKWIDEYYAWKFQVVELLVPVSPALSQRIQTLNRMPGDGVYRFWGAAPDFVCKHFLKVKSGSHRLHLRTLERRLEVLEEILALFSGTDWRFLSHHRTGRK